MSERSVMARQLLLAMLPPPEREAFVLVLQKLQKDTQENPDQAARSLNGFFGLVAGEIDPQKLAKNHHAWAAMVLLTMYFQHHGNWSSMIAEMRP